jgi:hypothetical protein
MKCTICGASHNWKKKEFCSKAQLENTVWKKLVYVQNKEKFKPGRFKLNNRYKKFYNKLDDYSPEDAAALRQKVGGDPTEKDSEETE